MKNLKWILESDIKKKDLIYFTVGTKVLLYAVSPPMRTEHVSALRGRMRSSRLTPNVTLFPRFSNNRRLFDSFPEQLWTTFFLSRGNTSWAQAAALRLPMHSARPKRVTAFTTWFLARNHSDPGCFAWNGSASWTLNPRAASPSLSFPSSACFPAASQSQQGGRLHFADDHHQASNTVFNPSLHLWQPLENCHVPSCPLPDLSSAQQQEHQ